MQTYSNRCAGPDIRLYFAAIEVAKPLTSSATRRIACHGRQAAVDSWLLAAAEAGLPEDALHSSAAEQLPAATAQPVRLQQPVSMYVSKHILCQPSTAKADD